MAYIGIQPAEKFTSFATQEFSTSATTSYTLDHAVANENELALFVNNVRQQPGSGKAYTATGTALTLSAATASTDTMYCVFLGRALQTVTPATNSITAAMVGNDLISGKTALASTPADTDEFLVSDAGTLKRIDYSLIKGATATAEFSAYVSSDVTLNDNTNTLITFQTELFDTDGVYNTSNGRFTAPSDGKYFLGTNIWTYDSSAKITAQTVSFYINGSEKLRQHFISDNLLFTKYDQTLSNILNLSEDDYVQVYVNANTTDSGTSAVESSSGIYQNTFFGFRLPT